MAWDRRRMCAVCLKPFPIAEFRVRGTHKYRVRCRVCYSKYVERENRQARARAKQRAAENLAIQELQRRIEVAMRLKRQHSGIVLTAEILASAGL